MNTSRYRRYTLVVELDSDYDDPAAFISDVMTSVHNGDEDVRITIAGHEYHLEILAVDS